MAKDLADRGQSRSAAQQLASQRMSKPVRAHPRKTGTQARSFNDVAYQVGADRPARCSAGQEQVTRVVRVAAAGQVGDQRSTDLVRQRETILPACLATHDEFAGVLRLTS